MGVGFNKFGESPWRDLGIMSSFNDVDPVMTVSDMKHPQMSSLLDEAFERMATASAFELPNGFVNHGPMGCEALAAMGLEDRIEQWSRRFERVPGPPVTPVRTRQFEWSEALGDYRLLPEWIGHLQEAIDESGWREAVATWVPRLSPAMSVKLFHGLIHVAHAARALTVEDTSVRRTELARAIGYWAARYYRGQQLLEIDEDAPGDLRTDVVMAAEYAGLRYLAAPSILNLHGITGAMAVELLIDHLSDSDGRALLAQLRAEHEALYQDNSPAPKVRTKDRSWVELAEAAAASGDVHEVKLVEACERAKAITGSSVFSAAAETVTNRA